MGAYKCSLEKWPSMCFKIKTVVFLSSHLWSKSRCQPLLFVQIPICCIQLWHRLLLLQHPSCNAAQAWCDTVWRMPPGHSTLWRHNFVRVWAPACLGWGGTVGQSKRRRWEVGFTLWCNFMETVVCGGAASHSAASYWLRGKTTWQRGVCRTGKIWCCHFIFNSRLSNLLSTSINTDICSTRIL